MRVRVGVVRTCVEMSCVFLAISAKRSSSLERGVDSSPGTPMMPHLVVQTSSLG